MKDSHTSMDQRLLSLMTDKDKFLRFLKSKAQLFHLSNVFFRDFQYGIISYAEINGWNVTYGSAEILAGQFIATLEKSGILKPVKPGSWMLNYPDFRTVSSKPEPSSKPIPSSAASKLTPASPAHSQSQSSVSTTTPTATPSSHA